MLMVLLKGDRLCGESVDVLGDRFVIEIRGDRCTYAPCFLCDNLGIKNLIE